jgi:hypothetical protein
VPSNQHERISNVFIAYKVSLELIRELRTLVPVIARQHRELAAQIRTAASSVTLNLSEGQRSGGGNQRRHYEIAHGSAERGERRARRRRGVGLDRWCRARARSSIGFSRCSGG